MRQDWHRADDINHVGDPLKLVVAGLGKNWPVRLHQHFRQENQRLIRWIDR
jgi:hypothetical protein